jgi:hypothetical protein
MTTGRPAPHQAATASISPCLAVTFREPLVSSLHPSRPSFTLLALAFLPVLVGHRAMHAPVRPRTPVMLDGMSEAVNVYGHHVFDVVAKKNAATHLSLKFLLVITSGAN